MAVQNDLTRSATLRQLCNLEFNTIPRGRMFSCIGAVSKFYFFKAQFSFHKKT